jgi:lambda repressor-like predicted transcriptional regulator
MQNDVPARKRASAQEREKILSAYRKSGLTQEKFAAQAGLSLSCLSNWLRRAKAQTHSSPASFLEVSLPAAAAPNRLAPGYRVELPGGIRLELPAGFTPAEAAELCRILRSL